MSDDYYKPGSWNVACWRCGRKRKGDEMRRQWQGFWVCPEHWEPRHPQDFVKGVPDNPAPPYSQPESWVYVGPNVCTPAGKTAIPGRAVPGCSIPANHEGIFP